MNPYLALCIAALALIAGGAIWLVFLRPVPELAGAGTIAARSFEAAHTSERDVWGPRRESSTRRQIAIPDGYILEIRLDGSGETLRCWREKTAGEPYVVGRRVRVRYTVRGIPLLWKRAYVVDLAPAD